MSSVSRTNHSSRWLHLQKLHYKPLLMHWKRELYGRIGHNGRGNDRSILKSSPRVPSIPMYKFSPYERLIRNVRKPGKKLERAMMYQK
nr:hypothetical protein Q903MT_gene2245 [Picea sitchensis]